MYLGIDIGTSAVKVLMLNADQDIIASSSRRLNITRPQPGWSEQQPESWWDAVNGCIDELKAGYAVQLADVRAIGLSGQMHGATLLDSSAEVIRPCILWNDGRSQKQCDQIEQRCPQLRQISGNIAMPGFTAPKLLWLQQHEPAVFERIDKILLPKDYIRLRLTGEFASDMSDSAGTLWLDTAGRRWSSELLAATDLDIDNMPQLYEGTQPTGQLLKSVTKKWGIRHPVLVAGGAGDNAASACGVGSIYPGDAFISLGTSGVIFVSNAQFSPNTNGALHAFCHALPDTWHQMGVILSAASCFDWLAELFSTSLDDIFLDLTKSPDLKPDVYFLPYLSGERTPHNNSRLRGVFTGLEHTTSRAEITHAVATGVAYAFRDCLEVLRQAGSDIDSMLIVGGGSRSRQWLQILSNVMDMPLKLAEQAHTGAAFGAARLAIASTNDGSFEQIFKPVNTNAIIRPDAECRSRYDDGWHQFRGLCPAVHEVFNHD